MKIKVNQIKSKNYKNKNWKYRISTHRKTFTISDFKMLLDVYNISHTYSLKNIHELWDGTDKLFVRKHTL